MTFILCCYSPDYCCYMAQGFAEVITNHLTLKWRDCLGRPISSHELFKGRAFSPEEEVICRAWEGFDCCQLEDGEGPVERAWEHFLGTKRNSWLTASRKQGTSILHLQGMGLSPQPEWIWKADLPRTSRWELDPVTTLISALWGPKQRTQVSAPGLRGIKVQGHKWVLL